MIASQPAWSPDGTRIAFAARPYPESGSPSSYNPPWDVWIMNADGSAPERLTPGEASELNPVWSPEGTLLAYGSNEGPRAGVYVMEPDGSNPRVVILTDEGGVPPWPSWAGPASDR
jgi:TolB protein